MPPTKQKINLVPTKSSDKHVIPVKRSEPDSSVSVSMDVQPAAPAVSEAPDPLQAVDYGGTPILLGMYVDLYFCKVVGFRADPNNRLNLLVIPALNKIVTNDPDNELNDQFDNKALLVSGYNCVAYDAVGSGASRSSKIDAAAKQAKADEELELTALPSNFLAPSPH